MNYRITGLSPEPFRHLYGLPDEDLAKLGVKRCVVNERPGFPDRVTMRDVELGEKVLLLNHVSQPADSPYRASHAIFVREGATQPYNEMNQIPEVMRGRTLSLRAFDELGMMLDAGLAVGPDIEPLIERLFANSAVSYIHVHYAMRGCFSGRIDRA